MFICKLCDKCLSSDQDILGTYCGHIFHKKCLDRHLIHRSPNCPSCEKFLRVDITCISTGYAVLSMFPEERKQDETLSLETNNLRSRKDDALQENVMLKEKLVEVIQALIVMQKELKIKNQSSSSILIPEHDAPFTPSNIAFTSRKEMYKTEPESLQCYNKSNKSITDMIISDILQTSGDMENNERSDDELGQTEEEGVDYTVNNASLMGSEMVILRDKSMLGTGLSEEEKNRIIRSKRREYLTWRNKAQSWLSKMEIASKRLLELEEGFTPEEYHEQLRLFYNKAYNQGGLVEEAKQAAAVYLIIDNIPEVEMQEIQEKVNCLKQALTTMLTSILNRMNSITIVETRLDEKLQLRHGSRSSSIESEYDDDKETVIESGVSTHPKIVDSPKGQVVMLLSGLDDRDIDREPVFV